MTPIPITGITDGWNVMASANGTPVSCNWHQALRGVPNDMHGFARTTGTKVKAVQGDIGFLMNRERKSISRKDRQRHSAKPMDQASPKQPNSVNVSEKLISAKRTNSDQN